MFKSGVGFYALFGYGWFIMGVVGFGGNVRDIGIVIGMAVALALMLTARRVLPDGENPMADPQLRRKFNQVNGIQWILIAGIAVSCGVAGVPALIPALVAIVVGAHFFPLSVAFRQPTMRIPGVALALLGLVGAVAWLANTSATTDHAIVGVGSGLVLWASAAMTIRGGRAAD